MYLTSVVCMHHNSLHAFPRLQKARTTARQAKEGRYDARQLHASHPQAIHNHDEVRERGGEREEKVASLERGKHLDLAECGEELVDTERAEDWWCGVRWRVCVHIEEGGRQTHGMKEREREKEADRKDDNNALSQTNSQQTCQS
jgi:hypothetical protein